MMNWKWMLAMGIVLAIGGVAALLFPFVASLAATGFAAAAFFVAGVLQLWLAFTAGDGSRGGRLVAGLLGLLMVVFAVSLFAQPLSGMVSLTILAGAMFLTLGVVRIVMAWRMRHRPRWGWLVASGALAVLLGLMILLALPVSALTVLGILLGVDLLTSGIAAIAIALQARNA
ncbi:HdeD family acid-resistance protein [Palleronia sediminis]|uniref:HdeD family acid-resistance protein n=2 Tax=Palleronia sediminis TaxID=2547833 RepID=A0A4R6AA48_9RHOB|nr:HdeD family acid-resistance protein [Palleronia sediminis]